MISTRELEQMKDGVVLVNTARGAVLDEGALVKALDSGKVASVGLDVYEEEPCIHPGLKANPNVMLLPHMGTWSVEVSQWLAPTFRQCLYCVPEPRSARCSQLDPDVWYFRRRPACHQDLSAMGACT